MEKKRRSRIKDFDEIQFHVWKNKMQMIFKDKDLWGVATGDEVEPVEEPTETRRRKFQRRVRKALVTICFSQEDEQLESIRSAKIAKPMRWTLIVLETL